MKAYHVSWKAERNGHWAEGFGHFTSDECIATFKVYSQFVRVVRQEIAGQLRANRGVDAFYEADNIKLVSINYLGETDE